MALQTYLFCTTQNNIANTTLDLKKLILGLKTKFAYKTTKANCANKFQNELNISAKV